MTEKTTTALAAHATHAVTTTGGIPGAEWLTPATMDQGMRLAELMADCTLVPDHLKKKPGDCFPILVQALRWRMDPFAVAQATAVVRGKLAYEGKLVHAVLISMGAIEGRLSFDYSGDGNNRRVTVTGTPRGDKPRTISGTVGQWRTQNDAWSRDTDMMLAYRGTRAWARLYCPDAMLGVYTPDELHEGEIREVEATVHQEPRPAKRRTVATDPTQPPVDPQPAPLPPAAVDPGQAPQAPAAAPAAGAEQEPRTVADIVALCEQAQKKHGQKVAVDMARGLATAYGAGTVQQIPADKADEAFRTLAGSLAALEKAGAK